MGINVETVQRSLAGLRNLYKSNYVGALKPLFKTAQNGTKLKYSVNITKFGGKVSDKTLNKSKILSKYSSDCGVTAEEISAKFIEAEKYLDEVSVKRLLKLVNERKTVLYTKPKKSRIFDDVFFVTLKHRGASTEYTHKTPKGILNYLENPDTSSETAQMLKQLLALEEQGIIKPETINQILKMQNAEFGLECSEFVNALKKGTAKDEQFKSAMLMMENQIPLKILNPKNFGEFCAADLREAANVLRIGEDTYSKNLVLKISSHLSKSKPVNTVSEEISTTFLKDFEKITKAFASSGKTIDELVSAGGIQLEYPRNLFKENILSKISHLSEAEQARILNKFGLEKGIGNRLNGLPVFADSTKGLSATEEAVNKEIQKFLYENRIILPKGFEELQAPIDEICKVFPEFKYVIGVNTNPAHTKPIAEHILMTFQENMKNPLYQTLNESDRKILGISTLLHDINKIEKIKADPSHALTSSQTAQAIVERMKGLSTAEKDRIIDLVKNHHWLENIQNGTEFSEKAIQDLAINFRAGNDFTLAKIFAESDLKAVNDGFFREFGDKLNSPMVKAVEDRIFAIQAAKGRIIYNADLTLEKGISKGAVLKISNEGNNAVTNYVIKAKDLNMDNEILFTHQTKSVSDFERAMLGCSHGGEGIISTGTTTYGNLNLYYKSEPYFLGFRQVNQANIAFAGQGKTGWNRGYEHFYRTLNPKTEQESISSFIRDIKSIYSELSGAEMTNEQYVKAYRAIQGIKPNEIHLNKEIQKIFGKNAQNFENAVMKSNTKMANDGYQVVLVDPEAGFLGTTIPYEQMSEDMQKFAQRHNLLIVEF